MKLNLLMLTFFMNLIVEKDFIIKLKQKLNLLILYFLH